MTDLNKMTADNIKPIVHYHDTLEYRTQMQRDRRRRNKKNGHKRLDITLSSSLFKRLKPHLKPYAQGTHYGYALVRFLEELEIVDG